MAEVGIGFHTDAFNSSHKSFEQALAWAQEHDVHYIEPGVIFDGVLSIECEGQGGPMLADSLTWLRKELADVGFTERSPAFA